MLVEERYSEIQKILRQKKVVSIQGLTELLNVSESTIRRDLSRMDSLGLLKKVHGGVKNNTPTYYLQNTALNQREMENQEEKQRIGEYTAGLVTPGDFIYVDSGSSILAMLDYLRVPGFRAVTNSTRCAYKIAVAGNEVILLSGHFNPILEATVGFLTIQDIEKYNFSKGFFGVNGIHGTVGYSTPDNDDAAIKRTAMLHCKERYILADPSKFNRISNISITALKDATIITTRVEEQFFASFTTIIQVDDLIFRGKTRPSAPAEVSGSPVAK